MIVGMPGGRTDPDSRWQAGQRRKGQVKGPNPFPHGLSQRLSLDALSLYVETVSALCYSCTTSISKEGSMTAKTATTKQPQEWAVTALGREQRAFLDRRIQAIRRAAYTATQVPDPAPIAVMRKKVRTYDQRVERKQRVVTTQISRLVQETRQAVLFARSAEAALIAVEVLERVAAKKGCGVGQ